MSPITFTDADFKAIDPTQDDSKSNIVEIEKFVVMKTLVDEGSSMDILYFKIDLQEIPNLKNNI